MKWLFLLLLSCVPLCCSHSPARTTEDTLAIESIYSICQSESEVVVMAECYHVKMLECLANTSGTPSRFCERVVVDHCKIIRCLDVLQPSSAFKPKEEETTTEL